MQIIVHPVDVLGFQVTMDVLFLIFGIILCSVTIARGCNMTAINECIPILSQGTDIDMLNDGISAIPSAQQLKKMCSMLGAYEACYRPKAAECVNDVVYTMTFGTIEKTIDYLCVEGFKDILSYETCWNKTAVTEGTKRCHDKQNSDIRDLRLNPGDKSKMKEKWCEILENTTSCVETTIVSNCGEAPACIMRTMLDRALTGLSGLMKCTLPTPCNITDISTNTPTSGVIVITQTTEPSAAQSPHGVFILSIVFILLNFLLV